MAHKVPPTEGFVETLRRVPWKGETRWMDETGKWLYTWDQFHGEFEVFTTRGHHVGVVDEAGRWIKPAKKGRTIDV